MYVKCVKRSSKYTVRAHDIFTYNFLNIQPIFNLKKSFEKPGLRAFQPYHEMLCMSEHVGGVKGRNDLRHLRNADERLRINRGRPVQLFLS